jgi:hypothetical protein
MQIGSHEKCLLEMEWFGEFTTEENVSLDLLLIEEGDDSVA